jgi:hypothetical protein
MGYNNPDVYYQPEKFDLVPVCEIDYSTGSYEFDLRVVWKHTPTGRLLTARDAGCSCPSPFEDYCSLNDLDPVDLAALQVELDQELKRGDSSWGGADPMDVAQFLRALRDSQTV